MTLRWTAVAAIAMLAACAGAGSRAGAPAPGKDGGIAGENAEAGRAYLAANGARKGVVTLESGLQYEVLRDGDGRKPGPDDTVVVHYRGTLVDGTEFGSSRASGRPGTFPVRAALPGLREALQRMATGSRWTLAVPPRLAYGERGGGTVIGPNATLVFDVELLSVAERADRLPPAGPLARIDVSFKLDPRLTRSLYLGDRWVSPATYVAAPQRPAATVDVRAGGLDAAGRRVEVEPEWAAADPDMVEVVRGGRGEARVIVKRAGDTTLRVASGPIARQLAIRARQRGETLAVEIAQAGGDP
jgi:hypothetical protein